MTTRARGVHAVMMQGEQAAEQPGTEAAHAARRAEAARERTAGQREQQANQRESTANERERRADERERRADERELHADERQQKADERERRIDDRARQSGLNVETLHQRTLEAIDRARELLALSAERLDRQEATTRRGQAGRDRDQAEVDRASAEAQRAMAALPPDPSRSMQQARVNLERAVRSLTDLADSRDAACLAFEELAALTPDRRAEYQAAADRERAAAHKAREVLRTLTE